MIFHYKLFAINFRWRKFVSKFFFDLFLWEILPHSTFFIRCVCSRSQFFHGAHRNAIPEIQCVASRYPTRTSQVSLHRCAPVLKQLNRTQFSWDLLALVHFQTHIRIPTILYMRLNSNFILISGRTHARFVVFFICVYVCGFRWMYAENTVKRDFLILVANAIAEKCCTAQSHTAASYKIDVRREHDVYSWAVDGWQWS